MEKLDGWSRSVPYRYSNLDSSFSSCATSSAYVVMHTRDPVACVHHTMRVGGAAVYVRDSNGSQPFHIGDSEKRKDGAHVTCGSLQTRQGLLTKRGTVPVVSTRRILGYQQSYQQGGVCEHTYTEAIHIAHLDESSRKENRYQQSTASIAGSHGPRLRHALTPKRAPLKIIPTTGAQISLSPPCTHTQDVPRPTFLSFDLLPYHSTHTYSLMPTTHTCSFRVW